LDYLTTDTSLSPIGHGFAPGYVNYKKGCTRFSTASDKDYQLLAHGRWFSPGTPAFSTTKTGRHDIAEILLKVALNTINLNQSIKKLVILYNFAKVSLTNIYLCCISKTKHYKVVFKTLNTKSVTNYCTNIKLNYIYVFIFNSMLFQNVPTGIYH
jgi:hypothetical protein